MDLQCLVAERPAARIPWSAWGVVDRTGPAGAPSRISSSRAVTFPARTSTVRRSSPRWAGPPSTAPSSENASPCAGAANSRSFGHHHKASSPRRCCTFVSNTRTDAPARTTNAGVEPKFKMLTPVGMSATRARATVPSTLQADAATGAFGGRWIRTQIPAASPRTTTSTASTVAGFCRQGERARRRIMSSNSTRSWVTSSASK